MYESGLHQQSGKLHDNIYLTLMQIYLNQGKTTKAFEKRISNFAVSQSPGIPKIKPGPPAKTKGRVSKRSVEIEVSEDYRISPSSTDSGKSDGDADDGNEEGGSTIMLDQVLDLLSRRWDRMHGAQALKLLPKETNLQVMVSWIV